MPPDEKGGDAPGGPREGFDFQNLHRNKRAITIDLSKYPELRRSLQTREATYIEDALEDFRQAAADNRFGGQLSQIPLLNEAAVYSAIDVLSSPAGFTPGGAGVAGPDAVAGV